MALPAFGIAAPVRHFAPRLPTAVETSKNWRDMVDTITLAAVT
jgi:hypothetical protein